MVKASFAQIVGAKARASDCKQTALAHTRHENHWHTNVQETKNKLSSSCVSVPCGIPGFAGIWQTRTLLLLKFQIIPYILK